MALRPSLFAIYKYLSARLYRSSLSVSVFRQRETPAEIVTRTSSPWIFKEKLLTLLLIVSKISVISCWLFLETKSQTLPRQYERLDFQVGTEKGFD